ncbi:ATP-binding protein [Nocardiopsis dassonvillei]|uniref:ATP-binding protein n=1 Tax=Nocardiopsis dassonvillei TaxID=2014 RepID=UPI000476A0AE|nr:ATP-binding protein [Nocardiopsis dassonvillei]MCK9872568.1 ATP-binding protein [Nocardiopsis dassonvillei]
MGKVIGLNTERLHGSNGERLPRRLADPRSNAPLTLDADRPHLGAAIALPGEPSQVAVMRRRIRARTNGDNQTEVLALLASELFTNALRHSRSGDPGGTVTVAVFKLPGRYQVRVTDQGSRGEQDTFPHPRPLDPLAEGGFGLHLVASEASRWGTIREGGRTTVWFEIDRAPRVPAA